MSYFMFFQKFNIYIALWFPYYQELKRNRERGQEKEREKCLYQTLIGTVGNKKLLVYASLWINSSKILGGFSDIRVITAKIHLTSHYFFEVSNY